ncbi:uncharacterized protein LOC142486275 isoform X3 [Ascaphus truei]|uniref:uncharacterized protein LOC142486275 isoform X3 n=1 Tax=Ascaphus truei TaxID=8439 RepID=UPI003F59B87D
MAPVSTPAKINMTHHIKHLSFGRDYPGIVNPLDGTSVDASQASMMFQYFVKIFPTVYVKVDGECPKMAAHGRTPFLPRGVTKMAAAGTRASMMFQYFVKIFPTVYVKVDGECPKMAAHGRTPFLPRGVTKMAAAGTRDLGKAEEETVFDPTSLDPERCESCYGAETEDIRCCNSFDDVREAYRRKGWAFKTPDSIAQCKREASARRWKSRGTRAAKCTGF